MKITSFNPLIVTPKAEDVIKLFEELGFEKAHTKGDIETSSNSDATSTSMKHPDGFRLDVTQLDVMPQDMTAIRMGVGDFDEAYELLTKHGFVNAQGGKVTDTGSSRATMMVSPSGFSIGVSKHIKK